MPAPTTRTPPPEQWPDWREAVISPSGAAAVAGIWLMLAPFALSYVPADPYGNDIVCGALIAAIGLIRIGGPSRTDSLNHVNAVIGAWIFAAAFWLDRSAHATANDLVVGAIVFSLSLAGAALTDRPEIE